MGNSSGAAVSGSDRGAKGEGEEEKEETPVIKAAFLASKKAKDLIFRSLMRSKRDKSNVRVHQKSQAEEDVIKRKSSAKRPSRGLSFEEEIRVRQVWRSLEWYKDTKPHQFIFYTPSAW